MPHPRLLAAICGAIVLLLAGCGGGPNRTALSGRACLARLSAHDVSYRSVDIGDPSDSHCQVDTAVIVETRVFDGEYGLLQVIRHILNPHDTAPFLAEFANQHVIRRVDTKRHFRAVVGERIERRQTDEIAVHLQGTLRMGNDPKRAPLNKWSQAHDCKNLFCVDGGPFVSQADKNITWKILELSMRTSEYIVDEMKKQNI